LPNDRKKGEAALREAVVEGGNGVRVFAQVDGATTQGERGKNLTRGGDLREHRDGESKGRGRGRRGKKGPVALLPPIAAR